MDQNAVYPLSILEITATSIISVLWTLLKEGPVMGVSRRKPSEIKRAASSQIGVSD